MSERLSIQEALYPQLMCFGCGHANPRGLHLRSYVEGDRVVADFTPWPEHDNGTGFLNGGIISTVLDCHGGAVAMHEGAQRGWTVESDASIPFITAGFDVRFLRPTPLDQALRLVGWAERVDEREIVVHTQVEADDKVRATMLATTSWRRARAIPPMPRPTCRPLGALKPSHGLLPLRLTRTVRRGRRCLAAISRRHHLACTTSPPRIRTRAPHSNA